jgi:arsenate reductase
MTAHWGVPDPASVQGTTEEIARAFHDAFCILDRRIGLLLALPPEALPLLALPLQTPERLAMQQELDKIGAQ